ncbi:protein YciO [Porphyridium purpureum]|uniref:Threonylcarbamoyl-AMP synthase n=1 Tax=Porphyridium purpureum TaxID=35688 RepID=A0A5J4YZD7_PORPP|nr:protein YciO [Porphyridium purpureum]|eukprot:POR7682..scf208_2
MSAKQQDRRERQTASFVAPCGSRSDFASGRVEVNGRCGAWKESGRGYHGAKPALQDCGSGAVKQRRVRCVQMQAAMARASAKQKQAAKAVEHVSLDPASGGDDRWKMEAVARMLQQGAVGLIPAGGTYAFACALSHRKGVERILEVKNVSDKKKALSIVCKDLSMVQRYVHPIDKNLFRILRTALPGPYTFILPATNEVPRFLLESGKKSWKRREIGIRIPDDPYCLALMECMDEPLLVSSASINGIPDDDDEEDEYAPKNSKVVDPCMCALTLRDAWCSRLDFVVDAGLMQAVQSTVVDCTKEPYEILRYGAGDVSVLE